MQLQVTNNDLQTQMMDPLDDVANAASQVALAVAQIVLTNIQSPTGGQSMRNDKAANLETFDGSQEKTKQFIQSIRIAVVLSPCRLTPSPMKG